MKDRKVTKLAQGSIREAAKLSLFERIEKEINDYTGAERAIASHLLGHRNELAFETAASLADKVKVSPVTVGRFCKRLGYKHYKDLKNDLRQESDAMPWLVGRELDRFVSRSGGSQDRGDSLQLEMAAVAEVYALAETPAWRDIVTLLADSDSVHIAGFQTERGLGVLMVNLLQYVRRNVHDIDPGSNHHADVFIDGGSRCVVLFDTRRYSRQTYLLARQCSEQGIPVILITDKFCDWASRFTPHVIALSTDTGLFWSSGVSMACAINLLVNQVVVRLGAGIERRLDKVSELHQTFTGYYGYPRPPRGRGRGG